MSIGSLNSANSQHTHRHAHEVHMKPIALKIVAVFRNAAAQREQISLWIQFRLNSLTHCQYIIIAMNAFNYSRWCRNKIAMLCAPVGVVNARHIINTIYILSCSCTRAFTSHNFCVFDFCFCFCFTGHFNKWHRLRCNGNDCVMFVHLYSHQHITLLGSNVLNTHRAPHIQSIFESPNVLNIIICCCWFFFLFT